MNLLYILVNYILIPSFLGALTAEVILVITCDGCVASFSALLLTPIICIVSVALSNPPEEVIRCIVIIALGDSLFSLGIAYLLEGKLELSYHIDRVKEWFLKRVRRFMDWREMEIYFKDNPRKPSVLAFKTLMKYADGKHVAMEHSDFIREWQIRIYAPDNKYKSITLDYHDSKEYVLGDFLERLKEFAEEYGGIYSKIYEDVKVALLPFLV